MDYFPRVRECREDHDLTQKEVGAYLGIDQRVYSTYETGKQRIRVDHLIRLSKLYGTSTDYLLGLTDRYEPY